MKKIYVIKEKNSNKMLEMMESEALEDNSYEVIDNLDSIPDLRSSKLLFCLDLNIIGTSNFINSFLEKMSTFSKKPFQDCEGAVLVYSDYNSFTKTAAQNVVYIANKMGCNFPGRPVVEATKSLINIEPLQKIYNLPLMEICLLKCRELGRRLYSNQKYYKNNRIAILHSSNRETSNTLALWDMVKNHLSDVEIHEIYLGEGSIIDCRGCNYKTCKHFGKSDNCFYGGIIVEEVYPAITNSSTLVMLCPNYNDMITANIVATINRLTALFRKTKFYDKLLFSIIVSGYSGSDAIAKQLISSLNMNKTFGLPDSFSFEAHANDIGSLRKISNIEKSAEEFASHILKHIR